MQNMNDAEGSEKGGAPSSYFRALGKVGLLDGDDEPLWLDSEEVTDSALKLHGIFAEGPVELGNRVLLGRDICFGVAVQVGANAAIGEGAVIGTMSRIGERSRVGPASVLGYRVMLGEECDIGSEVQVAGGTIIGRGTIIGEGAKLGTVTLGDQVFVGAWSALGMGTVLEPHSEVGAFSSFRGTLAESLVIPTMTVLRLPAEARIESPNHILELAVPTDAAKFTRRILAVQAKLRDSAMHFASHPTNSGPDENALSLGEAADLAGFKRSTAGKQGKTIEAMRLGLVLDFFTSAAHYFTYLP